MGHMTDPRGTLLHVEPLTTDAALPSAATNLLVRYASVGVRGPIVVTGTVSLPATTPPDGGWPVVNWAHGTVGTANVCAPSSNTRDGLADEYVGLMDRTLDRWVAAGYVVLKTDYEGFGTDDDHPYMHGDSAANCLEDLVVAARAADPRIGERWVAVGHSQGGQATLFAASRKGSPGLVGAVPIAPGGTGLSLLAPVIKEARPGSAGAIRFLPPLLVGAAAADPSVDPDALLTEKAHVLLDVIRTACLPQATLVAETLRPEDIFRPDADLGPLTAYLLTQEVTGLPVHVPMLIVQGLDDDLVTPAATDYLVSTLPTDKVTYKSYEGADHRHAVAVSFDDVLAFVKGLF
ncbi:secretory lipase [Alloactinosynnema sp. L-07]|nr:secretory lipase [Alloactinosynnema sp. L-07]